jgi:hypothetical protein
MPSCIRMAKVFIWLACILALAFGCWAALGADPPRIHITSPADGTIVNAGHTLSITVKADPSVFRSITLSAACFGAPAPELLRPPYVFSVSIPPDASSGACAIAAMATPNSGDAFVMDGIAISIEQPDPPKRLVPTAPSLVFSYVGETTREGLLGVFGDRPFILLTDSKYTTYSSGDPGIAKVDARGNVTALAPGKGKITIAYGRGSIPKTSIQVPVEVPRPIEVNPSTTSLSPLQTEEFSATVAIDPKLDHSVTWSIQPDLGRIDRAGVYTAPASIPRPQTVIVTATCVADRAKRASAQVQLLPRPRNE